MTRIRTDIVITCPELEMNASVATPLDLPSYTIVANTKTQDLTASTKTVIGNAYLGDEGAEFSQTNITFEPSVSSGKLTTGGQLYARNGATVTVSKGFDLWAREVKVDSANSVSLMGTTYLNDDLVIENSMGIGSVNVNLSGYFYAYGNAENAGEAQVFASEPDERTALTNNPASYSSAILINGRNATLDMSGLDGLILAGTAYVGTEERDSSNSNVQMGESVAIKSNQRAYLVPSEFLASYCATGGRNPMTESAYDLVCKEIAQKLYGSESMANQVTDADFLKASASTSAGIPQELANLHVTGVKKQVYQINLGGGAVNMVYFFLTFDSETDAIAFGNSKYALDASTLEAQLDTGHYNTSITYPSTMYDNFNKKSNTIKDFTFYYNGGLIVPETDQVNTTVKVGQGTLISSANASTLKQRENGYQDSFAAMRHALVTDYSSLPSVQRTRALYNNLVYDMSSSDVPEVIPGGMIKRFEGTGDDVAAGSEMAALVVNGDYTVQGPAGKDYATVDGTDASAPVYLIIASGDVDIKSNFTGLIISGGTVTIESTVSKIQANTALVQQALQIADDSGVMPVEYLINGESYLSTTGGSAEDEGGDVEYDTNVTFRNWSKQ
jgi:hypothetical protein